MRSRQAVWLIALVAPCSPMLQVQHRSGTSAAATEATPHASAATAGARRLVPPPCGHIVLRGGGVDESGRAGRMDAGGGAQPREADPSPEARQAAAAVQRGAMRGGPTSGPAFRGRPRLHFSRSLALRGRPRKARGKAGGQVNVTEEVAALQAQGYTEMSSRLIAGLRHGALECVICLGGIRSTDALWTCERCYCILHAACVREWARSSTIAALYSRDAPRTANGTARALACALCQSPQTCAPPASISAATSVCWCKRQSVPCVSAPHGVPRSCSMPCGRRLVSLGWAAGNGSGWDGQRGLGMGADGGLCPHNCSLLCHPGMRCVMCLSVMCASVVCV